MSHFYFIIRITAISLTCFFAILSFFSFSQVTLMPGFDGKEYIELLEITRAAG